MSLVVKSQPPTEPETEPGAEPRRRRHPVQARSRETVARIVDAAAVLIDEGGIDAVTTRAVAERAGITAPSLYRFFADREQILDQLVERHLDQLAAYTSAAEAGWQPASAEELVAREFDLFAGYFQANPSVHRLWLDGRVSATVRAEVHRFHHRTAQRLYSVAVAAGLTSADTDPLVFLMAVELGDRTLELAFRDRSDPDPEVIRHGRIALTAYLAATLHP